MQVQVLYCKAVFQIRVFIFRIRITIFFLSPDPDRPKIWIRTGKIRIHEKTSQNLSLSRIFFIYHTVSSTVFFCQAPPKPNQNHHLDPISFLMDGSRSGLLNPDLDWQKRTGSATLPLSNLCPIQLQKILHKVIFHSVFKLDPDTN